MASRYDIAVEVTTYLLLYVRTKCGETGLFGRFKASYGFIILFSSVEGGHSRGQTVVSYYGGPYREIRTHDGPKKCIVPYVCKPCLVLITMLPRNIIFPR